MTTLSQLHKEAGAEAFASIGKILSHNIPNAFKAVRSGAAAAGIVPEAATAIKAIGAGTGATLGAARGYAKADDQHKFTGALAGGVLGGAAGYGVATGVNKLPTFGKNYTPYLRGMGKHMQSSGASFASVKDYAANNFTDKVNPLSGVAPETKNFFGIGKKTKAINEVKEAPMGIKMMGDIPRVWNNFRDNGLIGGVKKGLFDNWHEQGTFNKTIHGKTFQFKRSAVGNVSSKLLMSGVGMGAMDMASSSNEDGSKKTVSQRVRKGATSALTWGMAPHLMMGKAMAWDVPRTILGGQKRQQPPQPQIY